MRAYFKHLRLNFRVAIKSLKNKNIRLFIFHFLHGLVPIKFTSHDYWDRR